MPGGAQEEEGQSAPVLTPWQVHWAAARDLKPGQLARMTATLAQWCAVAHFPCASKLI